MNRTNVVDIRTAKKRNKYDIPPTYENIKTTFTRVEEMTSEQKSKPSHPVFAVEHIYHQPTRKYIKCIMVPILLDNNKDFLYQASAYNNDNNLAPMKEFEGFLFKQDDNGNFKPISERLVKSNLKLIQDSTKVFTMQKNG